MAFQPMIKCDLVCADQNSANRLLTLAQNAAAKRTIIQTVTDLQAMQWHNGRWIVTGILVFSTQAEADAFYSEITSAYSQGPRANDILSGSDCIRFNRGDDGVDAEQYRTVK